jgi:hypothetical protein
MAPIDNAIAAIEVRQAGGKVLLREYANRFGVHRSTLGQRWRRVTVSQEEGYGKLLAVSSQQELELVRYIEDITKQGLPPTSDMIRNFASEVAHKELGSSWVARFVKRHEIHLISNWTTGLNCTCHLPDSKVKYRLYSDLLHQKITEFDVEAHNMYNMDETDFLIGKIGRSKKIFSRQ